MTAHCAPANPLFNNSRLITAAGQIDAAFIAESAAARAAYRYGDGYTADDLAWWTDKLTGMAEVLASQYRPAAIEPARVAA